MPAKADSRGEVLLRISQSLPVVAQPGIKREIWMQVNAILHESGNQPLLELVAVDAEIYRLCVILYVSQRQLTEGGCGSVLEGKRTQDCRTRLATSSTRGVMDHAPAKA